MQPFALKDGIMPVTIKDIAKKVGVSPSTVSRALTGRATISEETKKQISKAIEELNYHPNTSARNLANGITRTVCLLINAFEEPDAFSNAFFTNSVFGIERTVQEYGYDLLTTGCFDGKVSQTVEKLVLEKKTDGLIIPPSLATKQIIQKLLNEDIPFVILGEPTNHGSVCSWVDINNYQGGLIACQHLLDKGYKNIAFYGGKDSDCFVQKRLAGFVDCLKKNAKETENVSFMNNTISARDILNKNCFDGIVCNDNFVAADVLKAANDLNLSVPQQIGIVAFDNFPIAPYMNPPLSCVDIDTLSQGAEATRILIHCIEGAHPQQTLISTALIERESSKRIS